MKRGIVPLPHITAAQESVKGLVDTVAQNLKAAGRITDVCADAPFETRMIEIEKQFPGASVLLHKLGVLPPGVASLWCSDELLAVARQLLGQDEELGGHPVWNLRVKVPTASQREDQSTVPWHQDCAYLDGETVKDAHTPAVLQVTAWVPLVPARYDNGCMQVVRFGHRSGVEVQHQCCVGGTWYTQIAEGELERIGAGDAADVVTCEVNPGDVLFLQNVIPHRSLDNNSTGVRWSLDLRWQRMRDPVGFYGLKSLVPMVKPSDPSFKPDFVGWADDDRQVKQMEAVRADPRVAEAVAEAAAASAPPAAPGKPAADPFDTVIAGPWMGRWQLVHMNRHVERYLANVAAGGNGSDWHAMSKGGAFG